MPKDLFFPAGYTSAASVIGSPDTVRCGLEGYQKELGFGNLCPLFQFGSLGHEDFRASLALFTRKVMPALRPLGAS